MDGKHGPHGVLSRDGVPSRAGHNDDGLRDLLGICARTLRDRRPAEDRAGLFEQCRRLDEFNSALDAMQMRLRLAPVLGGKGGTSGPGTSPMHFEAVERLRMAINDAPIGVNAR
jgi:hypothetical protein